MGLRITAIGGRISSFHLTATSPRRLPGVGGFLLAAPILFGLALHGGRQLCRFSATRPGNAQILFSENPIGASVFKIGPALLLTVSGRETLRY
jgi:hypothetical protein